MLRALALPLAALLCALPASAEALRTTNPCVEFCGVFAHDTMLGTVTEITAAEIVITPERLYSLNDTPEDAPYVRDCAGVEPLCEELVVGDRRAFFFGFSGDVAYALDADDRLTDTIALFDGEMSAEVALVLGIARHTECMRGISAFRDHDKCQDPVPGGCASARASSTAPLLALLLLLGLRRRP